MASDGSHVSGLSGAGASQDWPEVLGIARGVDLCVQVTRGADRSLPAHAAPAQLDAAATN